MKGKYHKLKSSWKSRFPSQLCKCGCEKMTTPGSRYIYGHNNKGVFKIPIVTEVAIPFAIVKSLIDALQVHYDQFKKRIGESDDKKTEKK